jgi:hypothetical protein
MIFYFFQFSTPMVFLAVPVVFTIVEAAYQMVPQEKWLGDAELLLLCLYSLANAASTLAFVAPYRNYTLRLLTVNFTEILHFDWGGRKTWVNLETGKTHFTKHCC